VLIEALTLASASSGFEPVARAPDGLDTRARDIELLPEPTDVSIDESTIGLGVDTPGGVEDGIA
jgi:hypothetical protein